MRKIFFFRINSISQKDVSCPIYFLFCYFLDVLRYKNEKNEKKRERIDKIIYNITSYQIFLYLNNDTVKITIKLCMWYDGDFST